jgi:hypothetical protein
VAVTRGGSPRVRDGQHCLISPHMDSIASSIEGEVLHLPAKNQTDTMVWLNRSRAYGDFPSASYDKIPAFADSEFAHVITVTRGHFHLILRPSCRVLKF